MLEKIISKFEIVSAKLLGQTPTCKKCFKDIKFDSFYTIINKESHLCTACSKELTSHFLSFKIEGTEALAIYKYDAVFQSLIYQFKGCYDFELKDIFFAKYKRELSILYKGYTVVPAPSSNKGNEQRGFNHVEEIYKTLGLPMLNALEKTEDFKQADHNYQERKQIGKFLRIKDGYKLEGMRILLVDDIYTTGATMLALVRLLKNAKVRCLKVLVMCKTVLKEKI